ncbi:MAG: sulfotransferase [Candidatus Marinimicrobia bacterium]|nr:sulfotransferase [Candidatus Neomarinimicrobiota bacterium]
MDFQTKIKIPILVTGSHRSGTTWVGKMISFSPQVQYIYECFHPNGILRSKKIFDIWYQYLDEQDQQPYLNELERIFKYKYSFFEAFSLFDRFGKFNLRNSPVRIDFYCDVLKLRVTLKKEKPQPLLKDPIALFSADWIFENFQSQNIVLIRHPAAFVSSLRRLNWRFDFNNFLNQPKLMEKHLHSFEDQINSLSGNPIEEAAVLWNCIHHVIKYYHDNFPSWIFRRHEDLSLEPVNQFEDLYSILDLDFTNKIKDKIKILTGETMPGEVRKKEKIHQLKRNSKATIKNWKKRLSQDEINKIRLLTDPIANHFYSDEDW